VPQPTSPQEGVDDLVALLKAADVPGRYVLAAHSFSGTIARVFAGEHPDEVKGIVFVDVLTPELRAQMTPEEWKIWKRINARPAKALAAYPDLERQDFDETLDQTAAAAAPRPMPVVAHPRRLLDFVVDRRTLLISSVPQVGRRVRTRDEQDGGRSAAITLDVHHPASADVDPLGEGLGVRRGRVGSPSASGHHPREGGDSDDEHSHKLATTADESRAHGGGRCWTCSHDLLIAIVRG
jgi:pimeloyl-ACP methyl ester carboxylesterase